MLMVYRCTASKKCCRVTALSSPAKPWRADGVLLEVHLDLFTQALVSFLDQQFDESDGFFQVISLDQMGRRRT